METSANYDGRVRCTVQRIQPVDENREVENLITMIEDMSM